MLLSRPAGGGVSLRRGFAAYAWRESAILRAVTVALLILGPAAIAPTAARAQTIPARGTDQTLDVATWNIEWFGASGGPTDDALQFARVLAVMRQAEFDVWAVQEISDPGDFAALVDSLGPPYEGFLASQSGQQRIGFIVNTDVVTPRKIGHILTALAADATAFAGRPPLQLEADVTIGDSTRTLTFITIHMKCCGSGDDHDRRRAASGRLKNHIDFTTLHNQPVIILGDFNDELSASITTGRETPYRNFLDDPARYQFATLPLDAGNHHTYCGNTQCTSGSTLDHILITNELFNDLEVGLGERFAELLDAVPSFVQTTSDHLPVFARLRYGARTDAATSHASDAVLALGDPYPNPSRGVVTFPAEGLWPGDVTVGVFDVLGRRRTEVTSLQRTELSQGRAELRIETHSLPAGFYVLRVQQGSRMSSGTFVVAG